MKNPVIAAWLAVVICFSASTAWAADWTNGTFSCDLTVVETSHWPFTWGLWEKFIIQFSRNGKPYYVYECSGVYNSLCRHQSDNDPDAWREFRSNGDVRTPPGISKWGACNSAFNELSKKRK